MVNVNKLFPRLSIRVKLAIAFALVALGPLAVVSFMGARETVRQIESNARNALAYDLEMAETQTAREMQAAEQHVDLITKIVQGPLLADRPITGRALTEAQWVVSSLLRTEPSLYQVKLVDAAGRDPLPRGGPPARTPPPPGAASTPPGARASCSPERG